MLKDLETSQNLLDCCRIFVDQASNYNDLNLDPGLFDGKSGVALVFLLLSAHYEEPRYEKIGRAILEELSGDSGSINSMNFSDGFMGIGWTIEWLVQNGYLKDVNTDEILGSIDAALYKNISFSKTNDISLQSGILGKINYLSKRIKSKNSDTHRYKTIGNLEAFFYITDDLADMLLGEDKDGPIIIDNLMDLGTVMVILSGIADMRINPYVIENIAYKCVDRCKEILADDTEVTRQQFDAEAMSKRCYLAMAYLLIGKAYRNNVWIAEGKTYLQILVGQLNERSAQLFAENAVLQFRYLSALCILYTDSQDQQYKHMAKLLIKHLSETDLPLSIYRGKGKLVIVEMLINNPNLVGRWEEILFVS